MNFPIYRAQLRHHATTQHDASARARAARAFEQCEAEAVVTFTEPRRHVTLYMGDHVNRWQAGAVVEWNGRRYAAEVYEEADGSMETNVWPLDGKDHKPRGLEFMPQIHAAALRAYSQAVDAGYLANRAQYSTGGFAEATSPAFVIWTDAHNGKRLLCECGAYPNRAEAEAEAAKLDGNAYSVADTLEGVEPLDSDVISSLDPSQLALVQAQGVAVVWIARGRDIDGDTYAASPANSGRVSHFGMAHGFTSQTMAKTWLVMETARNEGRELDAQTGRWSVVPVDARTLQASAARIEAAMDEDAEREERECADLRGHMWVADEPEAGEEAHTYCGLCGAKPSPVLDGSRREDDGKRDHQLRHAARSPSGLAVTSLKTGDAFSCFESTVEPGAYYVKDRAGYTRDEFVIFDPELSNLATVLRGLGWTTDPVDPATRMPEGVTQDGADFYDASGAHVWSAPFTVRDSDTEAAGRARREFLAVGPLEGVQVIALDGCDPGELHNIIAEAVGEKRLVGTVNLAPTWRAVAPIIAAGLEDGTDVGRKAAREELARMAQAADRYHVLLEAAELALEALAHGNGKPNETARSLANRALSTALSGFKRNPI